MVTSIRGNSAELTTPNGEEVETVTVQLDDLILVAEFRDRIYPGLRPDGSVERRDDRPFHSVITGENFHALALLTFTHEQAVDVIYIDPPYNSGASDWKYNNNYVAEDDLYRHSKWLAFIERRLKLARRLLRRDGTLVVTIDEHEVSRLGVLLSQLFPESTVQLVTIVNNPKGVTQEYLSRVEEYAYFVFGPEAQLGSVDDDLLTHRDIDESGGDGEVQRPRWKGLLRSGDDSLRVNRKDMFYPVWFDESTGRLDHAGDPLPWGEVPFFEKKNGLTPIWPIRRDLQEGRWGVGKDTLNLLIKQGFAAVGRFDKKRNTWAVSYLSRQVRDDLALGLLQVLSANEATGVADVAYVVTAARRIRTVWHRSSHDAGAHGTDLIRSLLGSGRGFPFPKSLYAVEDTLRPLVIGKRDAVVLDFFAGSGTTAHALMRLNRQDGGKRKSILVTNNEVSATEQESLRATGFRPGDTEWERLGICDLITKPRIQAAIAGSTSKGEPVNGDYKFVDEFPMSEGFEENAAFFTLTYESPWRVSTDRAFSAIAPMLWLRAGAVGRRIDSISDGWDVADSYGIINDLDRASEFIAALVAVEGLRIAFIVTDDEGRYQQVANEIPGVETVRLYEDYLRNCEMTGDF
ncbi:DNA methyltransferase [Brachybacterium fresconis]|uniref:Adenine-specific DNA-methyltransferase n=1 Tax=Brachybacterium fresconis TaxID=173363 RepID=A0ABS4YJ44_9MICO|nr:adenine-specific DNA-methyltransferase [Brachybacterium fresconis]